jgi:hypothetical protein
MRYEKMDERIEVIAHFAPGKVQPLRFLWKGRPHRVTSVRGRWTTVEGRRRSCHFALLAEGVGQCEVCFDLESLNWAIQSVAVDS